VSTVATTLLTMGILAEPWRQSGVALPHAPGRSRAVLGKIDWAPLDSYLRTKGL
jgi:hypothetical protein